MGFIIEFRCRTFRSHRFFYRKQIDRLSLNGLARFFSKMGKHKNRTQNDVFIQFMENNPDIAKGYSKRDKPLLDSLWLQLAESLNSAGPPNKDVNGWKKVWTDWKSDVKKKLALNKAEERATGGGPYSKYTLTQTEEAIMRICGIARSVEGVLGTAIGVEEDAVIGCDDEVPTTSKRKCYSADVCSTPKKPRVENSMDRLKTFLAEDNERKKEMSVKIDEIIKAQNKNASSLRRVYRAIEKGNESVAKAITELKQEFVNFSSLFLQNMQERTDIKRQQVDLEVLKFEYEKDKSDKM